MLSEPAILVMVVALVSVATAGAVFALLPSSKGKTSHKRISAVAAASPKERRQMTDENRRRKSVEETLKELEEKQKSKKRAKPTLAMRMRQAGLSWSKQTYWLITAAAVLLMIPVFLFGVGTSPIVSILLGIASGLLLPHFYVARARARRFKKFSNEFANAVDVVVRGVKAGLPLIDCLKIIAREAQPPVSTEFQLIVEDQVLGLPMDEAVGRMAERIPLSEANFFSIVLAIQSRTGGSLAEALGNLSKVLRERKKMQMKIRSMSQEAKTSAMIIGALPLVVGLIVYVTSPDYIMLLFETTVGNIVLGACAFWMSCGVFVMRKMINFDF